MKKLGTLGLGLLISGTALSQSSVTSTKTGVKVPKFLQDVSVGYYTAFDNDFAEANEYSLSRFYQEHSVSAMKPFGDKVSATVSYGVNKTSAADKYETRNPDLNLAVSVLSAGPYSLATYMTFTPKMNEKVATNEFLAYQNVGTSVDTAIGSVSLSGALLSQYYYQSNVEELNKMGTYNRLSAAAKLKPAAVEGLSLSLSPQIYRGNEASTGKMWVSQRTLMTVSYQINKKMALTNTFYHYPQVDEPTKTKKVRNLMELNYSIF